MKAIHSKVFRSVLLSALLIGLSGCMTNSMLSNAKAIKHTDDKGKEVVDKKSEPVWYLWLPLTVPFDIVTLPFQIIICPGPMMGHVQT